MASIIFESDKRLTNLSDTIGKTVERVKDLEHRNTFLVVFTDGTFLCGALTSDDDSTQIEYGDDMWMGEAFHLGLLPEVEFREWEAQLKADQKAERDDRDRKQFEALKARFEGATL